ncbi:MAG TPA: protein kinase [Gemmatimonadales bacterium]|nr:protein kinase [Gemmatimonadales bacterium]
MKPERWQAVKELLGAALERAPADRLSFLSDACGADLALRAEVESLLAVAERTSGFLEPSAPKAPTDIVAILRTALASAYVIEREVGKGGMAVVYLAQDLRHRRAVALKVLDPELSSRLGAERFRREIETAARLDHPHILPVFDSGEAQGLLWYTMPYVEGESLRQRLERVGQLPVEEALRLTREAADALDCAHRHGIVHRDVKPENILLSAGHVRVADFGIATVLETTDGGRITQTGITVGSPAYMSPEQAAGTRTLDGRSDIYSLGCVLYELLAGEPPFLAPTPQAIFARRVLEPLPGIRTVRESVPESLARVLDRALAKSPADRYPDAKAFMEALDDVNLGEVRASGDRAPNAGTIAIPASGLRRKAVTRAMLIGAAIIALVGSGVVLARRDHGARASAEEAPRVLAVLPFKNLGSPGDQYFADGLTEEITSRLADVKELGVISRTSADRYRSSSATLKQIGRELGATYVLEGSVRWEKRPDGTSRIRVTPQLIRVHDDQHLWADRYDADLRDVFDVQAGIAEQVTMALGVLIAARAAGQPAGKPTTNLSAYDAYLRGDAAMPTDLSSGAEGLLSAYKGAAEHYQEAVELDSTFALAYAKLGRALLGTWIGDSSTAVKARAAVERALTLAPELSDAHLARGEYALRIENDTERGLKELETAVRLRPNDAEALMELGNTEWNLGRPGRQAIARVERAAQLDPRTVVRQVVLAFLYQESHRFDDAIRTYDRAIELKPENPGPYTQKAVLYLYRGDINGARRLIRRAAERTDSMGLITAAASTLLPWHSYGILDDGYQRAVLRLPATAFAGDTGLYGVIKGHYSWMHGDSARFRAYFDTAYAFATARLRESPGNGFYGMVTAGMLAAHGKRAEAYAAHERVYPNAWRKPGEFEARLCVLAGDTERALDVLEQRHWGNELTAEWLRVDPFWDPLRKYPRFQRLLSTSPSD